MKINHDVPAGRFVAQLPSGTAVLLYAQAGQGVLDLYSTYVPGPARGHGLGGKLVEAALSYARAEGYRVIPSCWFVRQWIRDHPEHQDLLAA